MNSYQLDGVRRALESLLIRTQLMISFDRGSNGSSPTLSLIEIMISRISYAVCLWYTGNYLLVPAIQWAALLNHSWPHGRCSGQSSLFSLI